MKKNVIIAGVPRAGKSTLASRLAKASGWQHIPMDMIVAGFETTFPETGINSLAPMESIEIYHTISRNIAPFIHGMIDLDGYGSYPHGMILDIYQLSPADYVKHIRAENTEIYFLGTADVTVQERFELMKRYDTPEDYTYDYSDEDKLEGCGYMVEQSRMIRSECAKYGLPYIETSQNREQVLEDLLKRILAE